MSFFGSILKIGGKVLGKVVKGGLSVATHGISDKALKVVSVLKSGGGGKSSKLEYPTLKDQKQAAKFTPERAPLSKARQLLQVAGAVKLPKTKLTKTPKVKVPRAPRAKKVRVARAPKPRKVRAARAPRAKRQSAAARRANAQITRLTNKAVDKGLARAAKYAAVPGNLAKAAKLGGIAAAGIGAYTITRNSPLGGKLGDAVVNKYYEHKDKVADANMKAFRDAVKTARQRGKVSSDDVRKLAKLYNVGG